MNPWSTETTRGSNLTQAYKEPPDQARKAVIAHQALDVLTAIAISPPGVLDCALRRFRQCRIGESTKEVRLLANTQSFDPGPHRGRIRNAMQGDSEMRRLVDQGSGELRRGHSGEVRRRHVNATRDIIRGVVTGPDYKVSSVSQDATVASRVGRSKER